MTTPSPSAVGNKFVLAYYTFMNQNPGSLRHFYKDDSVYTHGSETTFGTSEETVSGVEEINKKIQKLDFRDCQVTLSVVDCQASQTSGILVFVVGHISNKGELPRKFAQTFFLSEQSKGSYYVLNDVFRYLDQVKHTEVQASSTESPHAAEAARPQEPVHHAEPELTKEIKPIQPAPVQEASLTPAPPKEVAHIADTAPTKAVAPPTKSANVPQGNASKRESSKQSTPPERVSPPPEEKPVQTGPKSWANIANANPTAASSSPPPLKGTPTPQQHIPSQKTAPVRKEAERVHTPASLFVNNVPFNVTEEQIRAAFARFGEVKNISINPQKGFVFLDLSNADEAQQAIQFAKEGHISIDDRQLSVEERRERPKKDFKDRGPRHDQGPKRQSRDKPERQDRGERSERQDRGERERQDRGDRPERVDRSGENRANGRPLVRDQSKRQQ